jgi:hypothetical protein
MRWCSEVLFQLIRRDGVREAVARIDGMFRLCLSASIIDLFASGVAAPGLALVRIRIRSGRCSLWRDWVLAKTQHEAIVPGPKDANLSTSAGVVTPGGVHCQTISRNG